MTDPRRGPATPPQPLTEEQRAHVVSALPTARQIARAIRLRPGVTIDDVVQMVAEGFLQSAPSFDPRRGTFATYAWRRGWGSAVDGVTRTARQLPARRFGAIDGALEAADEAEDVTDLFSPTDETAPGLQRFCRSAMFRMLLGDAVVGLAHDGEEAFLARQEESRAKKELVRLIGELPERDRQILTLRHWEDRPWGDVGATVGLGEEAVRSRYRRILDELRTTLFERLGVTPAG